MANISPYNLSPIGESTAENYVQNGLVLHLDAFRPRRDGTMPQAPTALWEDLAGHYDCTISSPVDFANIDGVPLDGGVDNANFPRTRDYYVEFVASTKASLLFRVYHKTSAWGCTSISRNAAPFSADLLNIDPWSASLTGLGIETGAKACYQATHSRYRARINNLIASTSNRAETWVSNHGTRIVNTSGGSGVLWALRIYNHDLTDEEMEHNYQLDAKRFNLP